MNEFGVLCEKNGKMRYLLFKKCKMSKISEVNSKSNIFYYKKDTKSPNLVKLVKKMH